MNSTSWRDVPGQLARRPLKPQLRIEVTRFSIGKRVRDTPGGTWCSFHTGLDRHFLEVLGHLFQDCARWIARGHQLVEGRTLSMVVGPSGENLNTSAMRSRVVSIEKLQRSKMMRASQFNLLKIQGHLSGVTSWLNHFDLCNEMNLYTGAKRALSCSTAPATYITLPSPSSKLHIFTCACWPPGS